MRIYYGMPHSTANIHFWRETNAKDRDRTRLSAARNARSTRIVDAIFNSMTLTPAIYIASAISGDLADTILQLTNYLALRRGYAPQKNGHWSLIVLVICVPNAYRSHESAAIADLHFLCPSRHRARPPSSLLLQLNYIKMPGLSNGEIILPQMFLYHCHRICHCEIISRTRILWIFRGCSDIPATSFLCALLHSLYSMP